jgi:hypothetical protein
MRKQGLFLVLAAIAIRGTVYAEDAGCNCVPDKSSGLTTLNLAYELKNPKLAPQ